MPDITIYATRCKIYLEENGQNSFYIEENGHKTRIFVNEEHIPIYFAVLGAIYAKYLEDAKKAEAVTKKEEQT